MQTNSRAKRTARLRGFTLIEILIVIGMLAILATVVLVAVNPLRQFAQARNSQRQANVATILNAVSNRIADNRGIFAESGSSCEIPPEAATITDEAGSTNLDIRPCLVPTYLSELPFDPGSGSNTCKTGECTDTGEGYNTRYTIAQDADTSRITVCAPKSLESALGLTEAEQIFCLSR
ncbi:MAG: type II secretion system protein [Sphingobium sp.]